MQAAAGQSMEYLTGTEATGAIPATAVKAMEIHRLFWLGAPEPARPRCRPTCASSCKPTRDAGAAFQAMGHVVEPDLPPSPSLWQTWPDRLIDAALTRSPPGGRAPPVETNLPPDSGRCSGPERGERREQLRAHGGKAQQGAGLERIGGQRQRDAGVVEQAGVHDQKVLRAARRGRWSRRAGRLMIATGL